MTRRKQAPLLLLEVLVATMLFALLLMVSLQMYRKLLLLDRRTAQVELEARALWNVYETLNVFFIKAPVDVQEKLDCFEPWLRGQLCRTVYQDGRRSFCFLYENLIDLEQEFEGLLLGCCSLGDDGSFFFDSFNQKGRKRRLILATGVQFASWSFVSPMEAGWHDSWPLDSCDEASSLPVACRLHLSWLSGQKQDFSFWFLQQELWFSFKSTHVDVSSSSQG